MRTATRAIAVVGVLTLATVLLQAAPADAAPGPNLIINGSFEKPTVLTGTAAPPFGTCTTALTFDGLGISGLPASEGCWSLIEIFVPPSTSWIDRAAAKGGKQSVVVEANNNFRFLVQAVPAGAGVYRLQFLASAESSSFPIPVYLFAISGSTVLNQSQITFGPAQSVVDGAAVRVWTRYTLDITAPVGTDHLITCMCAGGPGAGSSTRFDAVTLKQQF